jgi:predicted nuclease of predicted toxin-antitoxin system
MPPTDSANWSFLVDEDMPRSTAVALRTAGYHADDVRDVGLRSRPDLEVYAYAQLHQQTIVTADMGFANILQFPLGTHAGFVVTRFPNALPTVQVNHELLKGLAALEGQSLAGILVIIEVGRVRVRRLS